MVAVVSWLCQRVRGLLRAENPRSYRRRVHSLFLRACCRALSQDTAVQRREFVGDGMVMLWV